MQLEALAYWMQTRSSKPDTTAEQRTAYPPLIPSLSPCFTRSRYPQIPTRAVIGPWTFLHARSSIAPRLAACVRAGRRAGGHVACMAWVLWVSGCFGFLHWSGCGFVTARIWVDFVIRAGQAERVLWYWYCLLRVRGFHVHVPDRPCSYSAPRRARSQDHNTITRHDDSRSLALDSTLGTTIAALAALTVADYYSCQSIPIHGTPQGTPDLYS